MRIHLDNSSDDSLFRQIAEQVKQLIAAGQLKPGDRLPAVRQLAQDLGINQNTVLRAYLELEQEGITISRRGGGTIITAEADDPSLHLVRQRRLTDSVNSDILHLLSLGYGPDELEAAFYLNLACWREERKGCEEVESAEPGITSDIIHIVGSNDIALEILAGQLKQKTPNTHVKITTTGSLGGLVALQDGRASIASVHLLDEETGVYNYPYAKHILPGRPMAIVHLAGRTQGLIFASENKKHIQSFDDLKRDDVRFVNRQKGSGTRVLFDFELHKHCIAPQQVSGYEKELDTHLAVAAAITRGEADTGLGIEAAARASNLGFLPLFKESFDLVMLIDEFKSRRLAPLLDMVKSQEFRQTIDHLGGYDTSHSGDVKFCN